MWILVLKGLIKKKTARCNMVYVGLQLAHSLLEFPS